MAQRHSEYQRAPRDLYETPEWVTNVILGYIPLSIRTIWEPAAGNGKMSRVLKRAGYDVIETDIHTGQDFMTSAPPLLYDAIVTNPPYNIAPAFVARAIDLTPPNGFMAMLLSTDFDHANTRRPIFKDHPWFFKKIALTKRIKWFEGTMGAPSTNHAWFIWRADRPRDPAINDATVGYGP